MSIELIRTRLVSDLGSIAGIKKVFHEDPDLFPEAAEMPCFTLSMRTPMLSVVARTNSTADYTWMFDLTMLYKPEGLGNVAENLSGLEDFIKLTADKLFANFGGGGTWSMINKDVGSGTQLDITGGILTRPNAPDNQGRVWGFTCTLDVTEIVNTTMAIGV